MHFMLWLVSWWYNVKPSVADRRGSTGKFNSKHYLQTVTLKIYQAMLKFYMD